jgi:hypothetical protein
LQVLQCSLLTLRMLLLQRLSQAQQQFKRQVSKQSMKAHLLPKQQHRLSPKQQHLLSPPSQLQLLLEMG